MEIYCLQGLPTRAGHSTRCVSTRPHCSEICLEIVFCGFVSLNQISKREQALVQFKCCKLYANRSNDRTVPVWTAFISRIFPSGDVEPLPPPSAERRAAYPHVDCEVGPVGLVGGPADAQCTAAHCRAPTGHAAEPGRSAGFMVSCAVCI